MADKQPGILSAQFELIVTGCLPLVLALLFLLGGVVALGVQALEFWRSGRWQPMPCMELLERIDYEELQKWIICPRRAVWLHKTLDVLNAGAGLLGLGVVLPQMVRLAALMLYGRGK